MRAATSGATKLRQGSETFLKWVALASVGLFLGCAAGAPAPEEGTTDVAIRNIAFSPKTVTIVVGERVRWTNREVAPILHTSTSGNPGDDDEGALWNSGILAPGESFTQQFDEVGEFVYFCETHQTMAAMRNARVIVVAPDEP